MSKIEKPKRDLPPEILLEILFHLRRSPDLHSAALVNNRWFACANVWLWDAVQLNSKHAVKCFEKLLKQASVPPEKGREGAGPKWKGLELLRWEEFKNWMGRIADYGFAGDKGSKRREGNSSLRLTPLLRKRSSSTMGYRIFRTTLLDLSKFTQSSKPFALDICASVECILSHLPLCTSLIFPSCRLETPERMLRHGTNLVTLDLRKCRATDHHMIIRAIGVTCPNLERIIFGGSLCEDPKLREAHLEGLANGCSKLRVVRIVGKNANMHLHASGLPSLFAHCKNLETVKIKRLCCFEYRTIIRSIAENNKHLRRIHFDLKYPAATSSDLILLAASCPDLRFLHLQPAPSFKDSGIRILATACPKLETVNLSSASSITDESIWALSWYCTSLTRVDVSRCPGLTTKSLTYFSSCKNLKSLTFNHTFDYLFDAGVIFKEVKGVVEGTQLVRLAFTVATGMSGDCPEQYRCRPRLGEDAARFVVKPGPVVSVHTDVDGTGNNNNPCTCGWDGSLHLAATGRERVIALGNLQIVDPIGEMLKAGMEWRHAIRKVLSRFANDALLSMGLAGVMEAATEAAAEAAEASAVYAAAARVVATQVGVGESGGET